MAARLALNPRTPSAPVAASCLLAPPAAQHTSSSASPKQDAVAPLKPHEYADAVSSYARLPTGAGQNYQPLADFLTSDKPEAYSGDVALSLDEDIERLDKANKEFVTLYHIGGKACRGAAQDTDSVDERSNDIAPLQKRWTSFVDPGCFYDFDMGPDVEPQSRLVFLRGFMSARWLNHIGARYLVDPEFFARHLNFQNPGDVSNTFSLPALPSASWHLIQLPIMTVIAKHTGIGSMSLDDLEQTRRQGAIKLSAHHRKICKLSKSGLDTGDSMVRDFHVFDETHFAIEQNVSICLTETVDGIFSIFVWLDGGKEFEIDNGERDPWSVKGSEGCYLPIIKHKNMVVLKSQKIMSRAGYAGPKHALSASLMYRDYGRSLRPSVMATDAFYALTEVFSFASSSEMAFLNLIEHKLDKYTEPSQEEFDMLPNLKYVKRILYRHIQKIEQVLESIQNTDDKKWPKSDREEGAKKAAETCKDLTRDFTRLRSRAQQIHGRCNEAIATLMSSMSIAESKKAIDQTERVAKLTFLAFVFVPLSFTTSFFGMNVKELSATKTSLWWWAAFSIPVFGFALIGFFIDLSRPFIALWSRLKWVWNWV